MRGFALPHLQAGRSALGASVVLALDGVPRALDDQVALPFLIYVALMILAASVVVAVTGPATLSRTHAKQVALP